MTLSASSVAAIIPVYNGATVVGRAIESALDQTHPPSEVLVVDDGSTDDTAAVVSRFPSPVRLLRQANAGPAAARNRGAREASAEWLAFLDADDVWLPRKLETQLELAGDSATGLIHCLISESYRSGPPPPVVSFDCLWRRNCITLSSTLVRRLAFEELGGFDEDPALISVEDYNLWLRLTAKGWRALTAPEHLCLYTPASGSLTSQVERFARAEFANLEKICQELDIPAQRKHEKFLAISAEYGREFLHARKLKLAREYLGRVWRARLSVSNFAWWLATFVPPDLLDARRDLRRRIAEHGT